MRPQGVYFLPLSQPDFYRQLVNRPHHAQSAGSNLNLDAQSAGIGAVAFQPKFELSVLIASVVSQNSQGLIGQRQQQIRITIAVQICRLDGKEAGLRRIAQIPINPIQPDRLSRLRKSSQASIAPRPQACASKSQHVQPAVVIIIQQQNLLKVGGIGLDRRRFWPALKLDRQSVIQQGDNVRAQIIVEIAQGNEAGRWQVVQCIAFGPSQASLPQPQPRRFSGTQETKIQQIVAIPILQRHLPHALQVRRQACVRRPVCKRSVSLISQINQRAVGRGQPDEIELSR